jgi:glycosyltransferase involved in cell wall biosynthesis
VEAGRIHLVSAGGDGGVFQHTVAVARLLAGVGHRVTLHMPDRNEPLDLDGLDVCRCVVWSTRTRRALLRRLWVGLRYLTRTNAHLLRAVGRDEILHFEGLFRPPLSASTVLLQRVAGRAVVHSPHNTFARDGGRLDAFLIRAMARAARATIVFSAHDEEAVTAYGGRPVRSPLLQLVPPADPRLIHGWRERWGADAGARVILFAGQIRADKRLDLVVRSAEQWPDGWRLAVVGPDLGAWEPARRLAEEGGVTVAAAVGYQQLEDFTAALAAADVVVCPYEQASQSGVLAVARQLGTATVAADVGGLADYADSLVDVATPAGLTAAIAAALDGSESSSGEADERAEALAAHERAYALATRPG